MRATPHTVIISERRDIPGAPRYNRPLVSRVHCRSRAEARRWLARTLAELDALAAAVGRIDAETQHWRVMARQRDYASAEYSVTPFRAAAYIEWTYTVERS